MAYISGIGLENFRVFENMTEFEFAPITILTGANNSGKSSVIKALLLLKDSFGEDDSTDKKEREIAKLLKKYAKELDQDQAIKFNEISFNLVYFQDIKDLTRLQIFDNTQHKIKSIKEIINNKENSLAFKIKISNYGTFIEIYNEFIANPLKSDLDPFDFLGYYNFYLFDVKDYTISLEYNHDTLRSFIVYHEDIIVLNIRLDRHNIYTYVDLWFMIDQIVKLKDFAKPHDIIDVQNAGCGNEFLKMIEDYKIDKNNYYVLIKPKFDKAISMEVYSEGFYQELTEKVVNLLEKSKYSFGDETTYFKNFDDLCKKISETKIIYSREDKNMSEEDINNPLCLNEYERKHCSIASLFTPEDAYYNEALYFGNIFFPSLINPIVFYVLSDVKMVNLTLKFFSNFEKFINFEYIEINKLFLNQLEDIYSLNKNERRKESIGKILNKFFNKEDRKNSTNHEFFYKWLNEFEIGNDFIVKQMELDEKTIYQFRIIKDGIELKISDQGVGINQILGLLLKIVSMKLDSINIEWLSYGILGSTIILEEPETNLHPSFQSKLAEMLAEATQLFGVQFIIETHSEYFIRKLQYLTAKKMIKPEDTALYYLHHPKHIPEGEQQVKRIVIREDGRLSSDFGPGFLDEATNLMMDIFKLSDN